MNPTIANRARVIPLLFSIESSLNEPMDLASMARQFDLSPFHFHRLFREALGETPRHYIERLRTERALLRLMMTDDNIREISHDVGFRSHETFSRTFRRRFQKTPRQARRWAKAEQKRRSAPPATCRDACRLSDVRCASVKSTFLLARRRMGEYTEYERTPFTKSDRLWNPLLRWAERHSVRYAKTPWGLTHDIPGVTPAHLQRFDACLRIDRPASGSREIQCLRFEGGTYAVVEHVGPPSTLIAAYETLVRWLAHAADRYTYGFGPSLAMYRAVDSNNPALNRTAACLPIIRKQSKKRQRASGRIR